MKFYRGDSIPSQVQGAIRSDRGHTFANHFCRNGLMAKFADGGSSALLQGKELLDMILSHVGYENDQPEQKFSYRSPFLSFTEDSSVAFDFAERTGKKALEECHFMDATCFVWELDIDLLEEIEPGRYELIYKSSSVNCAQNVSEQLQRGNDQFHISGNLHNLGMVMGKLFMSRIANERANADLRDHRAELIHVVRYVQSLNTNNCDPQLVSNTLARACRSREWLLYPTDMMEDGPGLSSRFDMNQHLRIHRCYREASTYLDP